MPHLINVEFLYSAHRHDVLVHVGRIPMEGEALILDGQTYEVKSVFLHGTEADDFGDEPEAVVRVTT